MAKTEQEKQTKEKRKVNKKERKEKKASKQLSAILLHDTRQKYNGLVGGARSYCPQDNIADQVTDSHPRKLNASLCQATFVTDLPSAVRLPQGHHIQTIATDSFPLVDLQTTAYIYFLFEGGRPLGKLSYYNSDRFLVA